VCALSEPSLGGNTVTHFATEATTGYMVSVSVASKSATDTWKAVHAVIRHFNQHHFVIKEVVTDHEVCYTAVAEMMASLGVEHLPYPPYSHCVFIERAKRTINCRMAAILASVPFVVPPSLHGELYEYICRMLNQVPNSKTGSATPVQLITGRRAIPFLVHFGQVVICYDPRDKEHLGEYGFIVNIEVSIAVSYKVYFPLRRKVLVRSSRLTPMTDAPPSWGFPSNPHFEGPSSRRLDFPDPAPSIPEGEGIDEEWFDNPYPEEVLPAQPESPIERVDPLVERVPESPPETPPEPPLAIEQGPSTYAPLPVTESFRPMSLPTPEPQPVAAPTLAEVPLPPPAQPSAPPMRAEETPQQLPVIDPLPLQVPVDKTPKKARRATPVADPLPSHPMVTRSRAKMNSVHVQPLQREYLRAVIAHITMKRALEGEYRELAEEAIRKEIKNIVEDHKSIKAIPWEGLSKDQRGRARRNFLFLVEKFTAAGAFDKMKARWVYGAANSGVIMDEELRDTRSPTANPITIMVLLAMAAILDHEIEVHDVPGAFLKATMPEDAPPLYGFVGPELTVYLREMYPHLASAISPKGTLYFRLRRYIYGTNEASKRFFDTMLQYFTSIGFTQSHQDPCLVTKRDGATVIHIAIYVDDLLIVATTPKAMRWISSQLREQWKTTHHTGLDLNYVGLHLVRDRVKREIRIDMSGNILKIIEQFGDGLRKYTTPATTEILTQSGDPLSSAQKSLYLSMVMSVLYPARLCHLAILFPTVILATRLINPTDSDLRAAQRIIGFLKTQVHHALTLRGTEVKLRLYADASHGLHPDGRGHGCIIACVGDSAVCWRSFKLPHVTLSSTESEISTCSECVTYAIWLRALLAELDQAPKEATPLAQDNTSAVTLMENGGQFKRSKHMLIRLSYLQEQVQQGTIAFFRCPTEDHIADIGTKPHSPATLERLMGLLPFGAPPHQEGV